MFLDLNVSREIWLTPNCEDENNDVHQRFSFLEISPDIPRYLRHVYSCIREYVLGKECYWCDLTVLCEWFIDFYWTRETYVSQDGSSCVVWTRVLDSVTMISRRHLKTSFTCDISMLKWRVSHGTLCLGMGVFVSTDPLSSLSTPLSLGDQSSKEFMLSS